MLYNTTKKLKKVRKVHGELGGYSRIGEDEWVKKIGLFMFLIKGKMVFSTIMGAVKIMGCRRNSLIDNSWFVPTF